MIKCKDLLMDCIEANMNMIRTLDGFVLKELGENILGINIEVKTTKCQSKGRDPTRSTALVTSF